MTLMESTMSAVSVNVSALTEKVEAITLALETSKDAK